MNKIIKRITLLMLLLIPFNVFAISYTLGDPIKGKEGSGNTYIEIKVSNVTGLKQTEVLTCSTTSGKETIDCTIEPNPSNSKLSKEGNIIVSTEEFTENQIVGRLAIKNKTYEDVKTKVLFEVNGTTYGNPIENVNVSATAKPASKDSSLSKLSISNGTLDPAFNSETTEYVVYDFPSTIRNIKFTYECDNCIVNSTSKTNREISVNGLNSGENEVKLNVKSEDGSSTTTYLFKVLRGENSYNSNKLKSLSIEGYELDPKFDKDTKEYTVKVPKKVESIESLIKYELEDSNAKAKVEGAGNLTKDENEVKITVTNVKNETNEYKIKVVKEDTEPAVIEIIGYKDDKVTFMNPDGVREELGKDEFKTKYPDEWKKIEDGTYQFDENGNIIKEKDEKKDDNKGTNSKKENKFPWIIVILIVLSLIIIGLAGFFIFRDPKKKDGKEENTDETQETPVVEPLKPEEPVQPTEEEQAELSRIDKYDEEARLEAENGIAELPAEPEETIVQEETIDDYVDESKTPTTDIDEALSDLMNTKEYNFKDKE